MNQKSQRVLEACVSTLQQVEENPMDPAVPRVTALAAELTTTTTALRDFAAAQINNHSAYRGAVDNRMLLKETTLEAMRELNKIARALNKTAFPNAREQFRMPPSTSYANLAAGARSFATHGAAMEAAFIERGRPATFVANLRTLATALDAAANARHIGRAAQVGATEGIEEKTREAVAMLRELDAIISPLLAGDSAALAEWKSAVNIENDPVRGDEDEEVPPGSGAVAAAGDPASAGGEGIAA